MSFGRHGWQIKEVLKLRFLDPFCGQGGVKIQATMLIQQQDPKFPPLGCWQGVSSGLAWQGRWTLQA